MNKRGITVVRGRVRNFRMNGKIERLFRTFKHWQRLTLLPLHPRTAQRKLDSFVQWFNESRPHSQLGILTPAERFEGAELPDPIPIRACADGEPVISVSRNHVADDPRLPVFDIRIWFEQRDAA